MLCTVVSLPLLLCHDIISSELHRLLFLCLYASIHPLDGAGGIMFWGCLSVCVYVCACTAADALSVLFIVDVEFRYFFISDQVP